MAPPIGLTGSELALQQALSGATGALAGGTAQARQDISKFGQGALGALGGGIDTALSQVQQGVGGFQPFQQAGQQALNLQGALSGTQGQRAFNQALIDSPAQRFLQQQGVQARLRGASATGGLGGGNIQRELTEFGQGLASTQLQNQINNLAQLSGQGLQATQGAGSLLGQGAGIAATGGQAGANLLQGTGQNLANLAQSGGINQANLISGTGQQLAQGRFQTGSALSNLLNQQGGGAADIIGGGATNIANLLSGLGTGQAGSQEQLAQLLANLAVQQSGQTTSLPSSAQFLNNQGIAAQLAGLAEGGGTAIAASDRRLKTNINKVGEYKGLNVYTWDWKPIADIVEGVKMTAGFMADEVMKAMPEAVVVDKTGYMKVNYGMILNG